MKQFLFALIDGLEWLILAALKAVWFVIKWTLQILGWLSGELTDH